MWAHQRKGSQLLLILVSCFLRWILCVYSDMDVCTCACLYVCVYVRMRLYIYIHVCMYVRTYVLMSMRMYVFLFWCAHVHPHVQKYVLKFLYCLPNTIFFMYLIRHTEYMHSTHNKKRMTILKNEIR